MENEKKSGAAKLVLLIFGIIFSVILVPGLFLGIPVGGVVMSLSTAASQESIEKMVEEANLSETLHEMIREEVLSEAPVEEINPEYWDSVIEDCFSEKIVDDIVFAVIDSIYNGTDAEVSLDRVTEEILEVRDELAENGFQDFYSAWTDGTPSKYFTEESIQSFGEEIGSELVAEYAEFGVDSWEELEEAYDAYYGSGAFSNLLDEKMRDFIAVWEESFIEGFDAEIAGIQEETETKINEAINEATNDPDVRSVFDTLKEIGEESGKVKLVVYGVILGAVLLLLLCYWFGTAGFVVPAVPLILGGVLCKLLTLVEDVIMNYANDMIAEDSEMAELGSVISDVFHGILTPIFEEISKLGTVTIGLGIVLIALAILKGVLKKNAQAAM